MFAVLGSVGTVMPEMQGLLGCNTCGRLGWPLEHLAVRQPSVSTLISGLFLTLLFGEVNLLPMPLTSVS